MTYTKINTEESLSSRKKIITVGDIKFQETKNTEK